MSEPKTYWEKRCAANEAFTDEVVRIIGGMMPPYVQEQISDLWGAYVAHIEELDEAENSDPSTER